MRKQSQLQTSVQTLCILPPFCQINYPTRQQCCHECIPEHWKMMQVLCHLEQNREQMWHSDHTSNNYRIRAGWRNLVLALSRLSIHPLYSTHTLEKDDSLQLSGSIPPIDEQMAWQSLHIHWCVKLLPEWDEQTADTFKLVSWLSQISTATPSMSQEYESIQAPTQDNLLISSDEASLPWISSW